MWDKFAIVWAIAVGVLAGSGVATADAKSKTSRSSAGGGACSGAYVVATGTASLAKAREAVLCLVNRERSSRGLGGMRASSQLAGAATAHSGDMVASRYFSHTSLDGEQVGQRVSRTGYPWKAVAETLGYGASQRSTPFRLVATMMGSAGHRSILLDRRYRELGVGLVLGSPARTAGRAASTLTLVFGRR